MIDPLRLADSTDDEVVRAMLRSARCDEAPADIAAKVAGAVGVALPVLATAALSKGAVAVSGLGGAGTWLGALATASAIKVAAVSFVVTGVALGVVGIGRELERGAAPPPRSSASTVIDSARARGAAVTLSPRHADATASGVPGGQGESPGSPHPSAVMSSRTAAKGFGKRAPAVIRASTEDEPTERGAGLERPMAPAVDAPLSTAAFADAEPTVGNDPAATAPRASSATQRLEREVAMLDAARRALAQGRAAEALTLLGRHRAEFARGALHPEAIILRVQALLARGQRADAEREAQRILAAAPGSRAADTLRGLLGKRPTP